LIVDYYHATLLQRLRKSDVTVEDLARAFASMDGKRDQFDHGKTISISDPKNDGHYLGYLTEMEEIIRRAIEYAEGRKP
jgi:hypothetical protein